MAPRKILLHGSGAIGTIYSYLLCQAGHDVTAVCRSNYEAAKGHGFLIDSEKYGQGIHFHPKVVRTPDEAVQNGPYDFLIVATKALPDVEMSKTIAPAVTKQRTTIVLIQNGIDIEDEYAEAYPNNTIISGIVYLPVTQVEPGVAVHTTMLEQFEIGTFPAKASAPTTRPAPLPTRSLLPDKLK